jgi:Protein of unknown function (DUF1236)
MKFGQSLAVSLAALLCTSSLALAQAPDKGGMGGGSQAPAERMEKGQPGGGARGGQESRQPSRGMSQSEGRGGANGGISERAPGGERSSNRSARPDGGKARSAEEGRKDRSAQEGRERNQDRAQRAGRDKDQDKAQRTARDKEQRARDRDQERAAQSPRQRDQDKAQRTDRGKDQGKAAQGRTPDANGQLQPANRVQASEKQHADVRQHLLRDRKIERSRINVAVNIGARVPRSVRLHSLSAGIIGFAPVYRGYSYVVLEDETICIVDPRTYVIVDVIPASTQRAEAPGSRGHLTLSADERRFVLTNIDKGQSADISVRLALGAEVPRAVEVTIFPDRVIERVPQLRSYRYVVAQDQVVIVDPTDRQVALLIGD